MRLRPVLWVAGLALLAGSLAWQLATGSGSRPPTRSRADSLPTPAPQLTGTKDASESRAPGRQMATDDAGSPEPVSMAAILADAAARAARAEQDAAASDMRLWPALADMIDQTTGQLLPRAKWPCRGAQLSSTPSGAEQRLPPSEWPAAPPQPFDPSRDEADPEEGPRVAVHTLPDAPAARTTTNGSAEFRQLLPWDMCQALAAGPRAAIDWDTGRTLGSDQAIRVRGGVVLEDTDIYVMATSVSEARRALTGATGDGVLASSSAKRSAPSCVARGKSPLVLYDRVPVDMGLPASLWRFDWSPSADAAAAAQPPATPDQANRLRGPRPNAAAVARAVGDAGGSEQDGMVARFAGLVHASDSRPHVCVIVRTYWPHLASGDLRLLLASLLAQRHTALDVFIVDTDAGPASHPWSSAADRVRRELELRAGYSALLTSLADERIHLSPVRTPRDDSWGYAATDAELQRLRAARAETLGVRGQPRPCDSFLVTNGDNLYAPMFLGKVREQMRVTSSEVALTWTVDKYSRYREKQVVAAMGHVDLGAIVFAASAVDRLVEPRFLACHVRGTRPAIFAADWFFLDRLLREAQAKHVVVRHTLFTHM